MRIESLTWLSSAEVDAQPRSEEALALAARTDLDAFEELVRRFQTPLLSFLRRFLHNTHDAEDALQETFVKLYRSRNKFNPRFTYRAWAFSIARNVVIDRARLRKLKITSIDPETLTDQSKLIDDDGSLWKLARRTLSPDQLQALWLRHVEDLSPREIALAMDCSWVKVRTLLSRAHRQLRAALSEIEIENKP